MTMIEASSPTEAVARWWAEQTLDPRHRRFVPGTETSDEAFGDFMLDTLAARYPVTREQADRFAEILQATIESAQWRSLMTDYGPDPEIGDAAEEVGIHRSRFPIKSLTTWTDDYAAARLGYGARHLIIWMREGWERPPCGIHDYNRETDEYSDNACSRPIYHDSEHGDWRPDPRICSRCGLTYAGHHNQPYSREDNSHSWKPTEEEIHHGGTAQD